MKTWLVLFALISAGACGLQVVADAEKARSVAATDADVAGIGLGNLANGYVQRYLRQRYELVATLSTRNYCLAIKAEGEARALIDQFEVHWCSGPDTPALSRLDSQRRSLTGIQVSTQLLRMPEAAPRGTC